MSGTGDQRLIRDLFSVLHATERQATPAFASLLDEARRRSERARERAAGERRRYGRPFAWIGAGATMITAAVLLQITWHPRESMSLEEAIVAAQTISAWTAPTAELLELQSLKIPGEVSSLGFESLAFPEITVAEATGPDEPTP